MSSVVPPTALTPVIRQMPPPSTLTAHSLGIIRQALHKSPEEDVDNNKLEAVEQACSVLSIQLQFSEFGSDADLEGMPY
eukprot:2223750-Amphidinium_carterae.1